MKHRLPLLSLVALACGAEAAPAPQASLQDNSAPIPWVTVRAASEVGLLSVPARVIPSAGSQAVVALPAAARVVRVRANVGELVSEGAPIADVLLPDVAEAAGHLVAARTRIAAYRKVLAQLDALDEHGLARLSDRTDADLKLAEAAADEQVALAKLAAAGVPAGEAERMAASGGRTTLRSPIAGRLAESRAVLGAHLAPSDGPLARISAAGDRATRVEARVPVEALSLARATFIPRTGGAREVTREGCLAEVESSDGTTRCWFVLEGAPLPAHLPGSLRLHAAPDTPIFAVPRAAVGLDTDGAFVLRHTGGGKSERVPVRVAASAGPEALIEAQLEAGERVAARAPAAPAGGAE